MANYSYNDISYMTTKELKAHCIEKCKELGKPRSWVQTATNDERKQFLRDGNAPNGGEPQKPTMPSSINGPSPARKSASTPQPSAGSMEEMIVNAVSQKLKDEVESDVLNVASKMETEMKDLLAQAEQSVKPVTIEIKDRPTIDLSSTLTHPKFSDVFEALHYKKTALLVGPAGTGKSTLVKQVWDKLATINDMDSKTSFQYIGCSAGLSEAMLLGKMDAHGKYHTGLAVDKFENGGLNLWDEADAMDGNAGLIRNAMLDGQGYIAVPNRTYNQVAWKHENYFDASCMNTFGDGQDFSYSGREQQDSATLDRLGDVTIFIDYDKGLEKAIIGEGNERWASMLWELRQRMNKEHIHERIISTRRFADAQIWQKAGKSMNWYIDRITTSWTPEELDKVNIKQLKREYK